MAEQSDEAGIVLRDVVELHGDGQPSRFAVAESTVRKEFPDAHIVRSEYAGRCAHGQLMVAVEYTLPIGDSE